MTHGTCHACVHSLETAKYLHDPEALRRALPEKLHATGKVLLPINEDRHWWLLVADCEMQVLYFFDSMTKRDAADRTAEAFRQALGEQWKIVKPMTVIFGASYTSDLITKFRIKCGSQENNYTECGVFTIMHARVALYGDAKPKLKSCPAYREMILKDIKAKSIFSTD